MIWAKVIPYIVAGLLAAGVLWQINSWREDANKLPGVEAELVSLKTACQENTTFTKDANHALKNRLDAITASYVKLLQTVPSKLPASSPAGGYDVATGTNESAWGLTATQRYANDAQAARLVACQDTLKFIYKQNGQESLIK